MADYITKSQLTDNLWRHFDDTKKDLYITQSTSRLNDLAQEKGVLTSDIKIDPVAYLVQEYCIAYSTMSMCLDYTGTNNNDLPIDVDKYYVKYQLYKSKVDAIAKEINGYILTGNVEKSSQRAVIQPMYRG